MARKVNLAALAAHDVPDSDPQPSPGVSELPIDKVAANPLNQRTDGDEDPEELEALIATVREHGVLQPLVVANAQTFTDRFPEHAHRLDGARWVALIGNRRLAAARAAGLAQIPALVNDARAGSMFEVMLIENSHRRDLAPLREAEAMRQVLERGDGGSRRDLARRIGRTHTYVNQRLALLALIRPLRAALEEGRLTVERARELGQLDEHEQQLVADAGPPYRPGGNAVSTRAPRLPRLPTGDPAAAAASIRAVYTGDQLAELVTLLSADST